MELSSNKKKIAHKIAKEAYNRRGELIEKYNNYEGREFGNVSIKLSDGFEYIYGKTIPEPQIMFPGGQQIHDMEFWEKLDYKFI